MDSYRDIEKLYIEAEGNQFWSFGTDEPHDISELLRMPWLKGLEICGNQEEMTSQQFHVLRSLPALTSLTLDSVIMGPQQIESFLAGYQTLEELYLRYIQPIDGTSWSELLAGLARGLKANSFLKTLVLPNRDGDAVDLTAMRSVFESGDPADNISTLKNLHFEDPYGADTHKSVIPLLSIPPFSTLQRLELGNMELDEDQAMALVEYVRSNTSLKELTINTDYYGYDDTQLILELLSLDWTEKELVYFGGRVPLVEAHDILAQLRANTSIEKLCLHLDIGEAFPGDSRDRHAINEYHSIMAKNRHQFGSNLDNICFDHVVGNHIKGLAVTNNLQLQSLPSVMSELVNKCPRRDWRVYEYQHDAQVTNILYHFFSGEPGLLLRDFDPAMLMIPEKPRHLIAMRIAAIRKKVMAGLWAALEFFEFLAKVALAIVILFVALCLYVDAKYGDSYLAVSAEEP